MNKLDARLIKEKLNKQIAGFSKKADAYDKNGDGKLAQVMRLEAHDTEQILKYIEELEPLAARQRGQIG